MDHPVSVSRTVGLRAGPEGGLGVFATVAENNHLACQSEFRFPRLPASMVFWLATLGNRAYCRHRRCIATSLCLDVRQGCWVRPEIPTQRCHATGVAWSFRDEDYASRPTTVVIAGSFQTVADRSLDELVSCVPPFDGLHLLATVGLDRGELPTQAVIRAGGKMSEADLRRFTVDDWYSALDANAARLTML